MIDANAPGAKGQTGLTPAQCLLTASLTLLASTLLRLPTSFPGPPPNVSWASPILLLDSSYAFAQPRKVCSAGDP